jgi:hypothetical protein
MSSPDIISTKLRPRSSGFFLFSLLFFVVLAPILFLFPQNVYAVDVTLAWDPNSEGDLAGYRIFYRLEGQSYDYDHPDKELWLTGGEGKEQLENPDQPSCTIYGLDDNTTYFVARAFDEALNESSDSNEVAYEPRDNEEPEANAVDQTVYEGQTVTLDSSGSYDPDGSIVSYSWTKTEGPAVTLSDPSVAQPTFTAPAPGVGPGESSLTFRLTVTDNSGLQSTDTCNIDILSDVAPSLTGLSITGASSVNENSTSNYTATATFSDRTTQDVTDTADWSVESLYATINDSAVLSTSGVTSDCTVTVKASYRFDSVTKTAQKMVTIVDVPESNLAPMMPVITSPYYSEDKCDLLLLITTEPFSDPDGDTHRQSQWQISKQEDFKDSPILDVTCTNHLTELPVPHTLLKPDTTYYVRVRFYDVYLEPSDWSDVISDAIKFTTASYNNDVDDNGVPGVPDDQEVDNSVDLNGDDTPDNNQRELIKCIQSVVYNATIGVCKASDSITSIEALETIDPATISDNTNRPSNLSFGLFSYRLSVTEPGATVMVRIYFSKDISKARVFYKYDTINGWQDYSEHTTFNNDGRSLTLEVKDGGYGDSDGVVNGYIVDPGGLAEASSGGVETSEGAGSSGGGGGSSSGGGCFIATAAFGSYAEPHVELLRDFRDQRLLTNMSGRWFVRMYYRYGPFWADLIKTHTWSKPIIRLALMPLVGISYVLIKACVVTRILAGLLMALFVLGCFLRMHRRPVTGGEQA